jgi:hypothetical protein
MRGFETRQSEASFLLKNPDYLCHIIALLYAEGFLVNEYAAQKMDYKLPYE